MSTVAMCSTFEQILIDAQTRIENFSEAKIKHLKEALVHGTAKLRTEDEMDMYLVSYGNIHSAKLLLAFSKLPLRILQEKNISVIDYGCGQGIASMILCDFLHRIVGQPNFISDIYMIEPSAICLQRAVINIHKMSPNTQITYFNNKCEDIGIMDIQPKSELVIHLLSNVIDMPDFPRERVSHKINNMNNHTNIVVCVSPFYQENGRAKHMIEFGSKLKSFSCYYEFEKHIDDWDNPFSCQIRIFKNYWF